MTKTQLAAQAGVTEAQLNAVIDALNDLDPARRAELIKAACELQRIAKENNISVDDLCRGATRYRQ